MVQYMEQSPPMRNGHGRKHVMSDQPAARPWCGTYLVQGHDAQGPWAYPGKGDPFRAHASLNGRGGQSVTILSSGQSDAEALTTETAVICALRAVGARLRNGPGGHHTAGLTPAASLGASLNPADGRARRRLTLPEVGTAILVPVNLLHGHLPGDVRPSTYKAWRMHGTLVTQLRRLLAARMCVRLLAVAPGGIIADVRRITAVKTFPAGSQFAGHRYFGLASDPDGDTLRGHYTPVSRQSGVRYLTAAGIGAGAFLALP
jgi:hypothetical protein